jgi:hypothetical protein
MDDISNRTLALLLVTSIIASLGFTLYGLNGMTKNPVTGRASSGSGRVNLTVASSVSITLTSSAIDFGTGYVNSSSSSKCGTNATLNAGQTYNDTENVVNTCWVQTIGTAQPTSLKIENDGNVNVQLSVVGPAEAQFFNSYGGSYPYNLTWRARASEAGSCVTGAVSFQQAYTNFGGTSKAVCSNMTYQPGTSDELAIDVKLTIPANIVPGAYSNSTIIFTAVQQS